ncbi:protein WHAT'S THIS FACTOR 9, mitochondrial [Jatropha curcas]|nr:protein WHAT'S THIS FACTOR 9, mitochondrial [Jatropha curcas]XP_037492070.1 protein WHAT'S THIS FACTOR 9, mitochondrial [Jatropha curcas]
MQFLFYHLPRHRRQSCHFHHQLHHSFVDFAAIKQLRDRGLDHAVKREKHLKPLLNIKNLIKLEPAKSLPLSIICQNKDSLKIPIRPIDFIRKYPSIFEEFLPGGIGIHPHIKLTPQVLDLDSEEELVYQSESYKQDIANRLLKLLMISRIDKIPLKILDEIKWDLGLPEDYVKSLVPDFPDCFRVIGNNLSPGLDSNLQLELVCWNNEKAISLMEKKATSGKLDYQKGMPIAFSMQFSTGFEMDKQLKKWYNEWQKLPYISPYENATHLGPSTDESDKWTVGVLHEVLSLFVSKKVERDTLFGLGEWLGIRSRFKRALLHHPGIFYLSGKMGTVVLREAYKRGLVMENNPLKNIRNQYVHLMNKVTEDRKVVVGPGGNKQQEKKTADESKEQREKDDDCDSVEMNDMDSHSSDSDDYEYDDEEDNEGGPSKTHAGRNTLTRGSRSYKKNLNARGSTRNAGRERLLQKPRGTTNNKVSPKEPSRREMSKWHNVRESSRDRLTSLKGKRGSFIDKRRAT